MLLAMKRVLRMGTLLMALRIYLKIFFFFPVFGGVKDYLWGYFPIWKNDPLWRAYLFKLGWNHQLGNFRSWSTLSKANDNDLSRWLGIPSNGGDWVRESNPNALNSILGWYSNLPRPYQNPWRIHVWSIYLHLVDFYGKRRQIYHTWIVWESMQDWTTKSYLFQRVFVGRLFWCQSITFHGLDVLKFMMLLSGRMYPSLPNTCWEGLLGRFLGPNISKNKVLFSGCMYLMYFLICIYIPGTQMGPLVLIGV